MPQRQVRTVPDCAGDREDFTCAVLGAVGRARRCATTGAGDGDSADNRGCAEVTVYRRHFCCGAEATLGFAVHCCEHAATSSNSLGEHSVQETVDFPQVQFLPDVRWRPG